MTLPSADSFFSGGGKSLSYNGDVVNGEYVDKSLLNVWRGGKVISEPIVQQRTDFDSRKPLFWEDGSPKLQLVVTLRCTGEIQGILDERNSQDPSDLGDRTLHIKGFLQPAVRDAVRAAGATGIALHGELYVCWIGVKATGKGKPGRIFQAKYVLPTAPPVAVPSDGPQSAPEAPNPWGGAPAVPTPAPAPTAPPAAPAPAANPWGGQAPSTPAPAPAQAPAPAVNPWG